MKWLAFVIDAVLVVAFAAIGMVQHHGGFDAAGLAVVAWPFLVALVAGWAVSLAWRAPWGPVRVGLPVWAVTVVGGLLLRAATGGGTATAFVIVTAVTLLVLLVGWRLIALPIRAARRSRTAA
ncbi:DUF3054 domain-containing protein [Microbacterium halophytorum]|uniref:DUF3054 domain-containing protein n=1 Tax=Microbacterium halophytorum TaxID=2067568 RepID=UPI000CFACDE8|nr:DUF3054 domain-containing protein [Microbacterium halophytorum]